MDFLLNEVGIEVAQEKIAQDVGKLSLKYEKTRDPKIKQKIKELILDRDEIYKGNKEIIKKYVGDSTKWNKKK